LKHESFTLPMSDGVELFVRHWSPEEGTPVAGSVVVAHGLSEHCERYAPLAEVLCAKGLHVYAMDHRGHGYTVAHLSELGHFADDDGWTKVVADFERVVALAKDAHPGLPVGVFGHSMGSSIVAASLYTFPGEADAAVLSGPTGIVGPIRKLGLAAAHLERLRIGRRGRSKVLNAMSFGDFNKPFEPARTPFDWLTAIPEEVDAYIHDPRCGQIASASLWIHMLKGLGELADPANLARIPSDLPVWIVYGDMDPVGDFGKGVQRLADAMTQAGVREVAVTSVHNGRHELLNDIGREELRTSVADFFLKSFEQCGS